MAAAVGQALLAGQQQSADGVQRVTLVATVPEGLLLDAAADVVDHRVGQLDGVEVIDDQRGVSQMHAHGGRVPTELGRELAAANGVEHTDDLVERITRQGFEPYDDDGVIRLSNRPFRQLADEHTEMVCGMNLAMLTGVIQALAADVRPRLDPPPDRCCVAFDHR